MVEEFVGVPLPDSTADLEVYHWIGFDEAVAVRLGREELVDSSSRQLLIDVDDPHDR